MKRRLPPASYYVFVARAEERPRVHVWPIAMDEPLPVFGIPLMKGDGDVFLDLQTCLTNVYDDGGFDLLLDYNKPSTVPLDPKQAAWAAHRILPRKKHKRGPKQ